LSESGRYDGVIESVTHVASGHPIAIRFGDTLINAVAGYINPPCGSACRFDIDADAVRIWPVD